MSSAFSRITENILGVLVGCTWFVIFGKGRFAGSRAVPLPRLGRVAARGSTDVHSGSY